MKKENFIIIRKFMHHIQASTFTAKKNNLILRLISKFLKTIITSYSRSNRWLVFCVFLILSSIYRDAILDDFPLPSLQFLNLSPELKCEKMWNGMLGKLINSQTPKKLNRNENEISFLLNEKKKLFERNFINLSC